jgi:hypothetical protein
MPLAMARHLDRLSHHLRLPREGTILHILRGTTIPTTAPVTPQLRLLPLRTITGHHLAAYRQGPLILPRRCITITFIIMQVELDIIILPRIRVMLVPRKVHIPPLRGPRVKL